MVLLSLTVAIVCVSARQWWLLLTRRREALLIETEPVWLPAAASVQSGRMPVAGLVPLVFALLKELSMEASIERAHQSKTLCQCNQSGTGVQEAALGCGFPKTKTEIYLEVTEHRFKGVRRCC